MMISLDSADASPDTFLTYLGITDFVKETI